MKKYVLKNVSSDEIVTMTLSEILEEINRDRSNQWQDYDENDWKEGLYFFTEFELLEDLCIR